MLYETELTELQRVANTLSRQSAARWGLLQVRQTPAAERAMIAHPADHPDFAPGSRAYDWTGHSAWWAHAFRAMPDAEISQGLAWLDREIAAAYAEHDA